MTRPFYFTAQTGAIDDTAPTAPSNYHRYRLPAVTRERVEAAVGDALVTSSGLVYPADFLRWLDTVEIIGARPPTPKPSWACCALCGDDDCTGDTCERC